MRVLRGHNDAVMDFVAKRMPPMFGDGIRYAGNYVGLGVIDDTGTLVAGVIYNEYQPQFGTIMVHLAADTPRWATHGVVKEILGYAFLEARLNKVWGSTPAHLLRVLRFNRGLGFKREAVVRNHYGSQHAVVTGMLAHEYKRFYLEEGGKARLARLRADLRKEEREQSRKPFVRAA